MSKTPRSDEAIKDKPALVALCVSAEFSRQLERELAAMQAQRDDAYRMVARLEQQRDEAQRCLGEAMLLIWSNGQQHERWQKARDAR